MTRPQVDKSSTVSTSFAWSISLAAFALGIVAGVGAALLIDYSGGQLQQARNQLQWLQDELTETQNTIQENRARRQKLQNGYDRLTTQRDQLLSRIDALASSAEDSDVVDKRIAELETTIKILKRQLTQGSGEDVPRENDFANFEENFRRSANWVSLPSNDDSVRVYGHAAGVRIKFWELEDGTGRAWFRYRPKDEKENDMAAVWLVLCSIGGETNWVENGDRISAWLEESEEILLLRGGFLRAAVTNEGVAEIDVYCPR